MSRKNNNEEYILCAAIWYDDGVFYEHQPFNIKTGFVICGHRHHNCFMTAYILNKDKKLQGYNEIQGFVTNTNNFVDRAEAFRIAKAADQILPDSSVYRFEQADLYSESMW